MIPSDTLKIWKEAAERSEHLIGRLRRVLRDDNAMPLLTRELAELIQYAEAVPQLIADLESSRDACKNAAQEAAIYRRERDKLIAEVERLRSGYLTDEHGNEYVQVCILKEKIREQESGDRAAPGCAYPNFFGVGFCR